MSYASEAAKLSRRAFTIVQLDLANTITTGGNEYHCSGRPPLGERFYSTIPERGFDPTPTKMLPGEGLPFLGEVRVTFEDFSFGPRGTYFGILLANNPYYLDRPLKVFTGFYDGVTFDWANFKEKLYFIKHIDGPDSNGRVTVTAHDILTLLDDNTAQVTTAPDAELAASLDASTTGTLDITDNTGFSATGGICQINNEYVAYSGISGADSIVTTARADYGTTAASHDAGDAVVPCYSYSADNVVDVIYDLIDLYSPIAVGTYINQTNWNTERDTYLIGDNVTGVIPAGEAIKGKINSLCKQTSVSVWWDDEDQLIKIKAIGPTISAAAQINSADHILDAGETFKRDPSKAVTTIIAYFGRKDHSADEGSKSNYSNINSTPDSESTTGFGKDKIETIFCPDVPGSGTATISKLISRFFSQRRTGIIEYKFRLEARDSALAVGDEVQVQTDLNQDVDGFSSIDSYLVVEKDQISPTVFQYTARATGFLIGSPYRVVAPDTLSAVTYATATTGQRDTYAFIADNVTEQFSNGDDAHLIL